MELNFDKEIDALLRKAVTTTDFAAAGEAHPDADEISAFAENVLSEKAKKRYTAHFADCDRCRTILSNLILLNAEAATETASSAVETPVVIETPVPWYQKLFSTRNLALTMGALVLVFAGVIGVIVLQNAYLGGGMISQKETYSANMPATSSADAPMEGFANTNSNTASNAMPAANSAPNFSSNPTNTTAVSPNAPAVDDVSGEKQQNEQRRADDADLAKEADLAQGKELPLADTSVAEEREQDRKLEEKAKRDEQPRIAKPVPQATPAPPKSEALGRSNAAAGVPKDAQKKNTSREGTRQVVSGKTFNHVNGVWVDSAYSKADSTNYRLSSTRTVQRGSNEYRKLDKDLRIIAESLEGPVIVVWKGKAYRIQ